MTPKEYIRNVIIAADQFGNALLWGAPDETFSSRIGREDVIALIGPMIRQALNTVDPGHTMGSLEFDELGFPDPHHMPSLAMEAYNRVMAAGDDYLALPLPTLNSAEVVAKMQRLRESGMDNCTMCGRCL